MDAGVDATAALRIADRSCSALRTAAQATLQDGERPARHGSVAAARQHETRAVMDATAESALQSLGPLPRATVRLCSARIARQSKKLEEHASILQDGGRQRAAARTRRRSKRPTPRGDRRAADGRFVRRGLQWHAALMRGPRVYASRAGMNADGYTLRGRDVAPHIRTRVLKHAAAQVIRRGRARVHGCMCSCRPVL